MPKEEIHIARISKSGVDTSRRQVKHQVLIPSGSGEIEAGENFEYVFGSISPRAGLAGTHLNKHLLDSPDNTRDTTTESDNNISSCSTLDIVNKVDQLMPIRQLESEVRELSQRLRQAEEQRSTLQRQLNASNEEKEICNRRLEVISAAHECRITEMHCVIAELSKKLRSKQENIIFEEPEPEGSEISYQEGSVSIYNSELNLTNPDAECQTEPVCDVNNVNCGTANDGVCSEEEDDVKFLKFGEENISRCQMEALQEEVLHLRAQIALLQSEMSTTIRTCCPQGPVVIEEEHIKYYPEELETNERNYSLEQKLGYMGNVHELNNFNIPTQNECETISSPQKREPAVAKKAERVKLHCASKIDHVTNMELLNNDLSKINLVENVASELKKRTGCVEPGQYNNELELLKRKIEHFNVRNTLLSLSLDESKMHTEHLYLLCGKYESNVVALKLALNFSDRAIEAYDVMLALLESKLALINDNSQATEDSRKAVESVARHLLDRLENEKNVCENSFGPWQNTFNIPDTSKNIAPWTTDDDNRLRYHVSKLKGRRSSVQNTTLNLEAPFSDQYEKKNRIAIEENKDLRQEKNSQYELELAVLMQELLNLRDENLQLKTKVDEAELGRQHANERINLLQLQIQLTADSNALFHQRQQQQENRISYSEAEQAALTEQQLVEALSRETELKERIQSLIASVSATQKLSDEKYEQLHQNVRELQKSNHNLGQMLDQNKRKYQQRIRKLEQKIYDLKFDYEHHNNEVYSVQIENFAHNSVSKTHTQHPSVEHVPETTL